MLSKISSFFERSTEHHPNRTCLIYIEPKNHDRFSYDYKTISGFACEILNILRSEKVEIVSKLF
jgi:hypothetical protein